MKLFYTLITILSWLNLLGQKNECDRVFHKAFYNFVTYDDSIGYQLFYRINEDQSCLIDTVEMFRFLLSSRFQIANSDAIKAKSDHLSTHPFSYLAHHTDHRKIKPLTDSSYKNSSNLSTIMKGAGRQYARESPIEVLQLYFISALYHKDYQFRNEIVLAKGDKIVTTNLYTERQAKNFTVQTVNNRILLKARKSYDKWLKIVDEKGLEYVRRENIDPLSFAKGIEWRNQKQKPF